MIILIIISIILDGVFSNFSNIFFPLFSLSLLPIIYKHKKNLIIYSLIIGLIYGLIFTNMFLLEIISYYICSLFIICFFKKFNYNIYNLLLNTLLNIILYRTINFIVLSLSNIIPFSISLLFKSIYSSLILNIIYIILIYLITNKKNVIKKNINYIIK